jgi:8-oxo-dGTP pyrophosphatase MutT (NUDIX family)
MTPMADERAELSPAEVPIRDAACVLIADLKGSEPRLLMGRRHADQVFLPNKWVFPGGRVEDEDRTLAREFSDAFSPVDLAREIKPFALAGIRELFEETGLLIGQPGEMNEAGAVWQSFAARQQKPAPGNIFPFARAITPPGRVRRYDTWFFFTSAEAISADASASDDELLDLGWFTLSEAGVLDLPRITRFVLEDVAALLAAAPTFRDHADQVPFYYSDGSAFRRALISCKVAPPTP